MFGLVIPLGVFCLVWMFFAALTTETLARLGGGRSLAIIDTFGTRFFYRWLNRLLFKEPTYDTYLFASILCANAARLCFGGVVVLSVFWDELPSPLAIAITCVLGVLVALFFGDFLPHLMAKKNTEQRLSWAMPLSSCFLWLCFPFTFIYVKLADLSFKKLEQSKHHDPIDEMKETILHLLMDTGAKGELTPADTKLIASVIQFKDRIVREVMVPRIDLFSLPIETTIRQATEDFLVEGYSRIPVYENSVDNIVGILMFKDFLKLYMEALDSKRDRSFLDESVKTMMKTVIYTPETKNVSQLLQEFRSKQTHMAIVVDEYGGTEGVVTLEDLLEEIVGEIADEYDVDDEQLYTSIPSGGYIVDARMNLYDAMETFHIKIPGEGDYDTIGGYVFHQVGSIPEKGLVIHNDDFTLEVLSTTDRNVEKVKILPRKNAS